MIFDSYNELISYINERVIDSKIVRGYTTEEAIAHSFDEYYYLEEEKYCFENLITVTKCINLMIDNKIKIVDGYINIFRQYAELVDDKEYLASQLDAEEVLQLERDVDRVNDYLNNPASQYEH